MDASMNPSEANLCQMTNTPCKKTRSSFVFSSTLFERVVVDLS
jgi:hypothetical protein